MSPKWSLLNNFLVVACIVATSVYAGVSDDMSTYDGISYSVAACLFFLWSYALLQFAHDFDQLNMRPLYFSPTLFPIYKYNPKTNDVEDHYKPTVAWTAGLVLLVFWAFFTNYALGPEWLGAVISIGVQLLVLMTIISTRAITADSMDDAYEFIDQKTVKKAWLDTKRSYFKSKGSYSRQDLLTYRRAWVRRHFVNEYMAAVRGTKYTHNQEKITAIVKEEIKCIGTDKKTFYKKKIDEFVDFEKHDPNDMADMAHLAHAYDMMVHETFLDELQQLLQFVMISVQNSLLDQQNNKKDFIRFLNAKKEVLTSLGINIQVPSRGSVDARQDQIDAQVDELDDK